MLETVQVLCYPLLNGPPFPLPLYFDTPVGSDCEILYLIFKQF